MEAGAGNQARSAQGKEDAVRLDRALDLYMGDLARRGYSPATRRSYWFKLIKLCDEFKHVEDVTAEDCARFLDQWSDSSVGTLAHSVTTVKCFFRWAEDQGWIEHSPAEKLKRPRRQAPEELDVITIGAEDVRRMLDACENWHEALCLGVLCYLGPRRRAASQLRWRDVDLNREMVKFREKGRKVITKPLPHVLAALLRYAEASPEVPSGPDNYVIPMQRKQLRSGERDDRMIWRTVHRVGRRVGVKTNVHAFRAAFAVQYLETHIGDLEALQALMGHKRIETTQVYLRRLNREKAMDRVRDLSWGSPRFEATAEEAPTGVEPVYQVLQTCA